MGIMSLERTNTFNFLTLLSACLVLIYIFVVMQGFLGCLPCGWKATLSPHILYSEFLPLAIISVLVVATTSILILHKNNRFKKIFSEMTHYWWLFFRVYIGYIWLLAGLAKANEEFLLQGFEDSIARFALGDPFPFYKSFLTDFILPNSLAFAYIIVIGEIAIGIFLMLGLFTRIFSVFAAFVSIQFLLASGWMGYTIAAENDFLLIFEILILYISAGRIMGLDQLLRKAFPKLKALF